MGDAVETLFGAALSAKLVWLLDDVLPRWADAGVDPHGGFFERLDQAGRPVANLPRRARVVARQTYVFAVATERGWGDYRHLVDHGLSEIFDRCLLPNGLSLSTYDPGGTPLRTDFDGYDQAFILFALAWAARLSPARRVRALAAGEGLLATMRARFRHPVIGFEEAVPRRLPLLQNPHMHLLEACLAFMDVPNAGPAWRVQAAELVELAVTRLADRCTGAIHEYFDGAWQPLIDGQGGWIEPGHQFEWAWLLWQWHDREGDVRADALARRLYAIGSGHGRAVSGQIVDALDAALAGRARTLRLWPQTERLKACLSVAGQADPGDRVAALAAATETLRCLDPFISTPVPGLWYDRLHETEQPVEDDAPASSLYHIVCALAVGEEFATHQLAG